MEDPDYSLFAKRTAMAKLVVIVIATIAFVLESELCEAKWTDGYNNATVLREDCKKGRLPFEPWANVCYVIELVSVVIFSGEYVVRLWACDANQAPGVARTKCGRYWDFVRSPMNVLDFVANAPFWVTALLQEPYPFALPSDSSGRGGSSLGFIRTVRLVRVFRVVQLGRYSLGLRLYAGTISRWAPA